MIIAPVFTKLWGSVQRVIGQYSQAYVFEETIEREDGDKFRVRNYVLRYPWHIKNWVENEAYTPKEKLPFLQERITSAIKSGIKVETSKLPPGVKEVENCFLNPGSDIRIKITRKPISLEQVSEEKQFPQ